MSSEVFVLSSARGGEAAEVIRQVVESAGVKPAQVQDAVLGPGDTESATDTTRTARSAGLACPAISVSSSMRAVFFAAQSILSGDMELVVVTDGDAGGCSAILLSAPEPIGRWNLMPRARLAARSLTEAAAALKIAGISAGEVTVLREGDKLRLVGEVLDELESLEAQWGMVTAGRLVLLIERV